MRKYKRLGYCSNSEEFDIIRDDREQYGKYKEKQRYNH